MAFEFDVSDVPFDVSDVPFDVPKKNHDMSSDINTSEFCENEEVVITDDLLHGLEELGLGHDFEVIEVETIVGENNSLGKKEKSEDYFEANGDIPQNNFNPFHNHGPILKELPGFEEMNEMVDNGQSTCLLFGCNAEVKTSGVNKKKMTPWYFLCSEHQENVTKKYGYGPK